jgi:L-2-hydroxyglutarate oxidase LhgO
MLKNNNILVVGAGITGITIANVLSKYNRITII